MRTVCPHCNRPLNVAYRTEIRVLPGEEPNEATSGGEALTVERVLEYLRRRGKAGATVREIQRALYVPFAAEVYAILETLSSEKRGSFVHRGRRMTFVVIAANARESVLNYLVANGCMSERELYRSLHMSFEECRALVETLKGDGEVATVGERPRSIHVKGCRCVVTE